MLGTKGLFAVAILLTLGALTSVNIAVAGGRPLVADLLDSNEVPPSGTGGSGKTVVTLNQGRGEICFDITTNGLSGPVIADHIHLGEAGANGPVVVSFQGQLSGCVNADAAIIRTISQNPTGYYVNLHTALKPGGEVRGQLQNPGDRRGQA